MQRRDDLVSGAVDFSRRIDILDPQQPLPAVLAGIDKACERCRQRSKVQGAAG
jgi:hypothetical protein